MLPLNSPLPSLLRLSILSVCIGLTACNDNKSSPEATSKPPVQPTTGSLTVTPSLGKISNADVILRQLNSNKVVATLNTGSAGRVTFNNIASDIGAVEVEVKATENSSYFDEATGKNALFSGSLHAALPFASNATVAVTPLTEAAYQYAKTRNTSLTTQTINSANAHISQLFGVADITQAVTLVASTNDLAQLKNNKTDGYALLLAAIAESAENILGSEEASPALKASLALAADATDGKIDGKTATGVSAPSVLPYATTNYAQSLNTQIGLLISTLKLPAELAQLVKLPTTTPPVEPPVEPPATSISASGSITTANTASPGFTPDSNGFELSVSDKETEYRFIKHTMSGTISYTSEIILKANAQGQVISVNYADFKNLGTTSLVCHALKPCQGVSINTSANSKSVAITFNNTELSKVFGGDGVAATLKGTLTGQISNAAAWSVADLPRSTSGALNVNGVSEPVISSRVGVSNTLINPTTLFTVTTTELNTKSGIYTITRSPTATSLTYNTNSGGTGLDAIYSCNNCDSALSFVQQGDTQQIKFNNVVLKNLGSKPALTLNNTVIVGSTKGSLNSSTEGSFEPLSSSVKSRNAELHYNFSSVGTVKQGGLSMVDITMRGNTVVSVSATVAIAGKVYICYEKAEPLIGAVACGNKVSLAADKRTLTLQGVTLRGGGIGEKKDLTLTGTLTNKGI